jgi:hypothetical protein
MIKTTIALSILFSLSVLSASVKADSTSGSLWTHNAKTPNGRSYLNGFVRGYIEGKQWGLVMMEGILPYMEADTPSRIRKKQIESKLLMETVYYSRALEEENLKETVDQVTYWYRDSRNGRISWSKLVDLAIGKVNGIHRNYTAYQLRWLQDVTIHRHINWFHTIDPATGEGEVRYYDRDGRIERVELIR